MKKLTIAERRQQELEHFNQSYIHDIGAAKHIINLFYRLVPLEIRNLENETERNIEKHWYRKDCEREEKMRSNLNEILRPYGLRLTTAWIHSTIAEPCEYGGVNTVYQGIFYN